MTPKLPLKPSPKHTEMIYCIEEGCGAPRWVKPQDLFQVSRCVPCQGNRKRGKSLARLDNLKAKVERKAQVVREHGPIKKLFVTRFHWKVPTDSKFLHGMRLRRIWP